MARRKLSTQGKVAAAGVSVAVAGLLAGFMAAGDHTAGARATTSPTASSAGSSSSDSTGGALDRGQPYQPQTQTQPQVQPQPQTRTGGS
jgi:hypothetical protein